MPNAGLKACAGKGGTCPNRIPKGQARCSSCRGGTATPRTRSRFDGFYSSSAWKALAARTILEEPTCRLRLVCNGDPSTVADHRVALEDGGAPLDRANTQGACNRCNVSKGQREAQARRARAAG